MIYLKFCSRSNNKYDKLNFAKTTYFYRREYHTWSLICYNLRSFQSFHTSAISNLALNNVFTSCCRKCLWKKKELSPEAPFKFAPVSKTSVTFSLQLKQKVCSTFFLLKAIISEIRSNMEALVELSNSPFNCTNELWDQSWINFLINYLIFFVNNKILKL